MASSSIHVYRLVPENEIRAGQVYEVKIRAVYQLGYGPESTLLKTIPVSSTPRVTSKQRR